MSDLHDFTARELVNALRTRQVSAREAVESHLHRIQEVDQAINAVVTLDAETALARAAQADELAASGADLPPMHGLPMTHKDTAMVAGMRSTMGSPALAENVPDVDDLLIGRLRAAGVIATGKTNVPEFGAGSHTFNEVFGTTTNPYATDRSAGGSWAEWRRRWRRGSSPSVMGPTWVARSGTRLPSAMWSVSGPRRR